MELSHVELANKLWDVLCADFNQRGIIGSLCDASFEKYGTGPLLLACEALADTIMHSKHDTIFVSFGFATPPGYVQETDGISGAIFLVKSLKRLGVTTALIIDERPDVIRITEETLKLTGLNPIFTDEYGVNLALLGRSSVPVVTLKTAGFSVKGAIADLFSDLPPSVIIFIEKAGHNYLGVYHSMKGVDVSSHHSRVEEILELTRIYDAITLAVGDGGNEVGMGVIEDTVRKVVPYGNICKCPCKGGIASNSIVNYLVTSVISNVGAYAIELLTLKLLGKLNYAHTVEDEILCLKTAVSNGAVDGVTGRPSIMVDGLPQHAYEKLLHRMLNIIV